MTHHRAKNRDKIILRPVITHSNLLTTLYLLFTKYRWLRIEKSSNCYLINQIRQLNLTLLSHQKIKKIISSQASRIRPGTLNFRKQSSPLYVRTSQRTTRHSTWTRSDSPDIPTLRENTRRKDPVPKPAESFPGSVIDGSLHVTTRTYRRRCSPREFRSMFATCLASGQGGWKEKW